MENKPAFAPQDTNLIKNCIQYYIKNGPFLSESEKNQYTALYHRMGRVSNRILREPVENPDAPYLRCIVLGFMMICWGLDYHKTH